MSEDSCCEDLLKRLFAFLDAELETNERDRLHRHVAECPECSRVAEAEAHLRVILRRSCHEFAPESLRSRVVTQITVLRLRGGEVR